MKGYGFLGLLFLPLLVFYQGGSGSATVEKSWVKIDSQAIASCEHFGDSVPGISLRRVASGGVIHRFFDTSPISPSGRYLALFRFPDETKTPRAGQAGDVVVVDLKTGSEKTVCRSRGYEMQLGANVQWGSNDHELIFNDVDTATWKAYAVVIDPATQTSRKLDGTVFMASADGRKLASYNLLASRYAQVGYGVVVPDDRVKRNIGPVADDGLDITDVKSGKCSRLVSIRKVYEETQPSIKITNPENFEYYFFQVKWNPQGTRLLTTLQWSPIGGGPRKRSVITMRADGSELRTAVTPEMWANGGHHVNWTPDGEHLSMNLNVDGQPGLELVTMKYDGTTLKTVFTPGSGHPSFHPKGLPLIITDAYPDEPVAKGDGTSPLRLIDVSQQKEILAGRIFVSMKTGEFRVDPHPAWDRTGRFVVFNGFSQNTREVYMMDLTEYLRTHSIK